jgi:hypothetical protein
MSHTDYDQEEFNAAMHEYYEKPYSVKCAACGLEQTNSEYVLKQCGWILEKGSPELCFQAKCIRDRQPITAKMLAGGAYDVEVMA